MSTLFLSVIPVYHKSLTNVKQQRKTNSHYTAAKVNPFDNSPLTNTFYKPT